MKYEMYHFHHSNPTVVLILYNGLYKLCKFLIMHSKSILVPINSNIGWLDNMHAPLYY